ncbi:hypothetical protein EJ04DRAFT_335509 [Polyplosphaeria fusca]|uniref:Fungal N-terminal domain-containing protein n=1 Tax=Polyplosphaeria fusca TaxID=682080 RepID=A0A9P4RAA4_9PLEO|nr:hypothetical protein EJ04DRAFT_335509 [Polyplosphaeria fusca]
MSGLEGLAVAASIIQVADAGLRISQTVYAYAESVRSADKRLKDVAIDVRVTSDIVRHVAELFDDFGKHVGPKELQTANECVNRCKAAFKEVEEYANKAKPRVSKWRFPLRERKLELMDAKLEQLKTSLHIMLTVIQNKNELKIAVERKSTRMTTHCLRI